MDRLKVFKSIRTLPCYYFTLPGIGDAYVRNDLVKKKLIPDATYREIIDKIITKQGPADNT